MSKLLANTIPKEECQWAYICATQDLICHCNTHIRIGCPTCGNLETLVERTPPSAKKVPQTAKPTGPTGAQGPTGNTTMVTGYLNPAISGLNQPIGSLCTGSNGKVYVKDSDGKYQRTSL